MQRVNNWCKCMTKKMSLVLMIILYSFILLVCALGSFGVLNGIAVSIIGGLLFVGILAIGFISLFRNMHDNRLALVVAVIAAACIFAHFMR